MNKYDFCEQSDCDKFREKEEYYLRWDESAFDVAADLQNFVNTCSESCPNMPAELKTAKKNLNERRYEQ